MSVPPEVVAVLGTIGGGVIVGLFGVWTAKIQAKAANQRHFRELVVTAATDGWKLRAAQGTAGKLPPLEHAIIHAAKMCEIALADETLTPEALREKLEAIRALMDVLAEHVESVSKAHKAR